MLTILRLGFRGGVAPTLNAFDNGDVRAVVLILFEGDRRDGVRVHEDITPTLQSFMGTGGNNVPMIAFGHKDFGGDAGEVSPTLRSMNHDQSHMNGGGNVAVAIGFSHTQGIDAQPSEIAFPTLRMNGGGHAVATTLAVDFYNQTLTEKNQSLRSAASDVSKYGGVLNKETSIVRRLTPVECERLQGFPDDWTAGQADSHRYKQMGNAVTVNVAEWVGRAIMAANDQ